MIPQRIIEILKSCESEQTACFPPTEVFNEGWMLRLALDAIQTFGLSDDRLRFLPGARWFSEALLSSPFAPRTKQDPLGEGFTNADAVVGHFVFRPATKAGLTLSPDARQFVVFEAKLYSNLSSGTKNAPTYNQAARNVACMARAIERSATPLDQFQSLGFFVIAPELSLRQQWRTNLEDLTTVDSVRAAVDERISAYEKHGRPEIAELRSWQTSHYRPLVDRLAREQRLAILSWEKVITLITEANTQLGDELNRFYQQCLAFAPPTRALE